MCVESLHQYNRIRATLLFRCLAAKIMPTKFERNKMSERKLDTFFIIFVFQIHLVNIKWLNCN